MITSRSPRMSVVVGASPRLHHEDFLLDLAHDVRSHDT